MKMGFLECPTLTPHKTEVEETPVWHGVSFYTQHRNEAGRTGNETGTV